MRICCIIFRLLCIGVARAWCRTNLTTFPQAMAQISLSLQSCSAAGSANGWTGSTWAGKVLSTDWPISLFKALFGVHLILGKCQSAVSACQSRTLLQNPLKSSALWWLVGSASFMYFCYMMFKNIHTEFTVKCWSNGAVAVLRFVSECELHSQITRTKWPSYQIWLRSKNVCSGSDITKDGLTLWNSQFLFSTCVQS